MITKIAAILLIGIISISCSPNKRYTKEIYKNMSSKDMPKNYKFWYLVDSLTIEYPVIAYSEKGGRFIMSQETLQKYNGKQSFFLENPYVYLYESDFAPDMYSELPPNIIIRDNNICPEKVKIKAKKLKGIKDIYSKGETLQVYIFFVRGDYYKNEFEGLFEFQNKEDILPYLDIKDKLYYFYKIAIPICD